MSDPSQKKRGIPGRDVIRRTHAIFPEKPALESLETKWSEAWQQGRVFVFDRNVDRDDVFSIDTPPPTVSGSLHVGHVFSYTHTDIVARYQRMRGKSIFYPMGWDDNGLPTERRVENYYGVLSDPDLPYQPNFVPPSKAAEKRSDFIRINRRNFVELCHELTHVDEQAFRRLWERLGVSVDWELTYATIDERSQRVSQRAFLRNLARGELYSQQAPCLWDITFQTAVAQAELEDRESSAMFHELRFTADGADPIVIATTRPELLPSCVAVLVHPDDERYRARVGTSVRSPLFDVALPVLSHDLVDPEKGSGAVMVCTFGDLTDVVWWRELQLPTRSLVGKDGRLAAETPDWFATPTSRAHYEAVAGKYVGEARKILVTKLRESGELLGEPRPIQHHVKYFEKGDRPLEIVATRQWYVRNGGRDGALRDRLLERGAELAWHPEYMRMRYDNWVGGLNGDWLISRQRVFGVPIPVWYRVESTGEIDYGAVIRPDEAALPIDPRTDVPVGFTESQRGVPGGFVGDPDVMDTWATSSLTPLIACGWEETPELFAKVFPMDMRPQAHDIIRTWLFSTLVRSHFEHDCVPWKNVCLSGWILDPDRKKMSKSKGNVITPHALLEQYGSDGVRYWAALGRPGADTAFEEKQMKIGRRLALKLLNAAKFGLAFEGDPEGRVDVPIDLAMLQRLSEVVSKSTDELEDFEYSRALERIESFFWWYCDDYVELVKFRAYGAVTGSSGTTSAKNAIARSLSAIIRLFAPFLPFASEESWSWWMSSSVHLAPWPTAQELLTGFEPIQTWAELLEVTCDVLGRIRRSKSEAAVSMKAEVARLAITDTPARLALLRENESSLRDAGNIREFDYRPGDAPALDVVLA